MALQLSNLQRGKTGPTQRFSLARSRDPTAVRSILDTFTTTISPHRRTQILFDSNLVSQFVCVMGDSVGYLTKPFIVDQDDGESLVLASFSDNIGQPFPVSIPLELFLSHFSTLVRRGDAATFSFPTHPAEPDEVGPPTVRALRNAPEAVEASLERLNFPMGEEPTEEDRPVIAALPQFLPIPPGHSFDAPLAIANGTSVRDSFPLLSSWLGGISYARAANENQSVTIGGPLFDIPSLQVQGVDAQPFDDINVMGNVFVQPTLLLPTDQKFQAVANAISIFSDTTWSTLGASLQGDGPALPAVAAAGLTAEQFVAGLDKAMSKEKKYKLAPKTLAKYSILMSSLPAGEGASAEHLVLPDVRSDFLTYLNENSSASAADDLRELVRNRLAVAAKSDLRTESEVSFEPRQVTVAFSNCVRTFTWLDVRLLRGHKKTQQTYLGLVHFLPPDKAAVEAVAEGDAQARSLTLANASDSKAALAASTTSKLYCGGRCSSFRDVFECIVNFRYFMGVVTDNLEGPVLMQILRNFITVIMSRDGRLFFDGYGRDPKLAHHLWQDVQLVVSKFFEVASNVELYSAVTAGHPISVTNFDLAKSVATSCLNDLQTVVAGSGLQKYAGIPVASEWFSSASHSSTGRSSSSPPVTKKPRLSVSSPEEDERRKGLGLIEFDASVAGTSKLPSFKVYHKKKGAKSPERLCMNFLTKGFFCPNSPCKNPHVANLDVLADGERKKFIDLVKSTPGFSWAPNKAPPGTT